MNMSRSSEKKIGKRLLLAAYELSLTAALAYLALYKVFNGPSPAVRNALTMTLLEPSATKWIPYLFLPREKVEHIRDAARADAADPGTEHAVLRADASDTGPADIDWSLLPDGIKIEELRGRTYNAHVMLVRDPSRMYLALSSYSGFSETVPGKRLSVMMEEEQASAGINAGAFNDDGTGGAHIGSVPAGLTIHGGRVVSDTCKDFVPEKGFCGFNKDHVLVVSHDMSAEEARREGIEEGCAFGPVLIRNGEIDPSVYAGYSGYNPRSAIGQRPDGTVILLCADGRQAGSLGATYKDLIDVMVSYGACTAFNLDGGSSTAMFYRDSEGKYGTRGEVRMINSYSVLQSVPRRMPTFWMVRPMGDRDHEGV